MKIQLDYDNKRITIENNVKFGEFMTKIKAILPDWKEWELQTNTVIYNSNPIIIRDYSRPWWVHTNPVYLCDQTTITTTTNDIGGDVTINPKGLFTLELN